MVVQASFEDACGDYLRSLTRDYHISQDFLNTSRAQRQCVFSYRYGAHLLYVLHADPHAPTMSSRIHSCIVRHDLPRRRLRMGDLLRYDGTRTIRDSFIYGNVFDADSYVPHARWQALMLPKSIHAIVSETW